jgi:PucR family transcriptional regulator, purine catabolism regulatory protein
MTLQLGDVIHDQGLGLELITAPKGWSQRRVAGAHAIEIPDPTAWLEKKWILLTTGMRLRDAESQRALIANADQRQLAAVGLGIGFTFNTPPKHLVEEAISRDVPLFTIPFKTPFCDIVRSVDRALLSDDYRKLHRRMAIQTTLTAAMVEPEPKKELVQRLATALDGAALIMNGEGVVISSCGQAPADEIWHAVQQMNAEGAIAIPNWDVYASPTHGTFPIVYWVIAASRRRLPDAVAPAAVTAAAQILDIIESTREAVKSEERRRQARLIEELLDPTIEVAPERLTSAGFSGGADCHVAVIAPAQQDARFDTRSIERVIDFVANANGCPSLVMANGARVVLIFETPGFATELVQELLRADTTALVAVGRPFRTVDGAAFSFRDAEMILKQAPNTDAVESTRILRFEDVDFASWLIGSQPLSDVMTKADSVLEPLQAHPELLQTLLVYLRLDLDVPRAAEAMHLHPNSLRYRINRIEAILNLPMRNLSTIVNLYLAAMSGSLAVDASAPPGTSFDSAVADTTQQNDAAYRNQLLRAS